MTTTTVKPHAASSASQAASPTTSPRPSQAVATDPERALRLAANFTPDVELLTTEGLIAFGVKGSGKSNLLALLVEQLARFLVPQLIVDTEREYQSLLPMLPHGVIATASRYPSGADILRYGLQVIVDLQSWPTDEEAALFVCRLIDELFTATNALAPQDRVPCIIHLDEAGYWLPQEAVTYLSKQTRKMLADAFHTLASRGRKQGLTPFLYTQSISEIAKSAIRQAGIKVLMRQTLDLDLARYAQYIQGATAQTRRAIAAYPCGKAVVLLPDGSQLRVQFHARQSEHVSHAPQVQAALIKFATQSLDVSTVPMREEVASVEAEERHQVVPPPPRHKVTPERPPQDAPVTKRIAALLEQDPTLSPAELSRRLGCSEAGANKARRAYFLRHPEQEPARPPTISEQVVALLVQDPTLSAAELGRRLACDPSLTARVRSAYFVQHPEQQPPAQGPSATEQLQRLLAEDPALSVSALCARVGCGRTLAAKARRIYFHEHPEQVPTHGPSATEQVRALLEEDPTLSVSALWMRVGCNAALASNVRRAYFVQHPQMRQQEGH